MLSLRRLPVCVLCASLHYTWHLWFHALHTPHGRSFSSSDSSSLLSPPFITHPLCSITILINLTSAHIRTAISLSLLTKNAGSHTQNVTDWRALTCVHAPWHKHIFKKKEEKKRTPADAHHGRSRPEAAHKYKQMSASWRWLACWGSVLRFTSYEWLWQHQSIMLI